MINPTSRSPPNETKHTFIRLGHYMPQPCTLLAPLLTPRKPEIIRRLLRPRAYIHHIGFNAYVLYNRKRIDEKPKRKKREIRNNKWKFMKTNEPRQSDIHLHPHPTAYAKFDFSISKSTRWVRDARRKSRRVRGSGRVRA